MVRNFRTTVFILVFLFFALVVLGTFERLKSKKNPVFQGKAPTPTKVMATPTQAISPPASPTAESSPTPVFTGKIIYVKPDSGPTIQQAWSQAQPGDIIDLAPGVYMQDVVSQKSGEPSKPITIRGPKTAVVKGAGSVRIFEINHSYITLDGFTVDGLFGSPDEKSGYRDKLLYFIGNTPLAGPSYNKIMNMDIKNAGGECVRLRYYAQHNEVVNNHISNCGAYDFKFNDGGKNGEGIYIGTAPEQRDNRKNPTNDVDNSNGNWVHNNFINTQGNECTDIKEGASGNIVEYNDCTGQKDENSGGFDARGNENVFRYNQIHDNHGVGVRLGGDNENDGINNHVYNNVMRNNDSGAIKFQRKPQGKICGNDLKDNGDKPYVGPYGKDFDPGASC